MVSSSIKRSVFSIFIIFFTSTFAFSQSYPNTDYRRFSLSLNGGISLGDINEGYHFMSSNFSSNIEDTPTFGVGLQYALSPAWSVELGYQRTQIRGISNSFETDVNLLSLKNILNLNQLIFVNNLSGRLNPFISVGVGYDFFHYRGTNESFNAQNTSLNGGFGLAYKLTNTVDLFTHYEYHVGSNGIDNEKEGWGADLINSVTGGIRINFGKKEAKHLSWRTVPMRMNESDYNRFLAQADKIEELQHQLAQREVDDQNQETKYYANLDSSEKQADHSKTESTVSQKTSDYLQCINTEDDAAFTNSLAGGHYVQILATHHLMVANYIQCHANQKLNEAGLDSDHEILIYHRKNYYEIMIGKFETVAEARKIQDMMTSVHDDAFVITFPRPAYLDKKMGKLQKPNSKNQTEIMDQKKD